MITEPATKFSGWKPWQNGGRLDLKNEGGVYVLARFQGEEPLVQLPGLDRRIVYIGETKNLKHRLLRPHDAIVKYVEVYGDAKCNDLWVSVCPLFVTGCERYEELRAYTEFLEAKLGWNYVKQFDKRPRLLFKRPRKARGTPET